MGAPLRSTFGTAGVELVASVAGSIAGGIGVTGRCIRTGFSTTTGVVALDFDSRATA